MYHDSGNGLIEATHRLWILLTQSVPVPALDDIAGPLGTRTIVAASDEGAGSDTTGPLPRRRFPGRSRART